MYYKDMKDIPFRYIFFLLEKCYLKKDKDKASIEDFLKNLLS